MQEMKKILQKIIDKYSFNQIEAEQFMGFVLDGRATENQVTALLSLLCLDGSEIPEITGIAKRIRKVAVTCKPQVSGLVDITGTGGALIRSFNVSTIAALIAAGAGVPVAKQIDFPVQDDSAAALLAELGVKLTIPVESVKKCIEKIGIGFLYAPLFHPALERTVAIRQELGFRNALNLIWPLTNPAPIYGQVVGVFEDKLTTVIAGVLRTLGVKKAFVVHGEEGMDEISITGETRISELKKGLINTYSITPERFNMQSVSVSAIIGGTVKENARITEIVLANKEQGPRTDLVLLNAAAAIAVSNKADSFETGLQLAQQSLYSGAAKKKLTELIAFTNKYSLKKVQGKGIKIKSKKYKSKQPRQSQKKKKAKK
jgi:anthranilate phosphoribosyltransferase